VIILAIYCELSARNFVYIRLYSFIFDISIVQCLGVYYFTGHSVEVVDSITAYF